MTIFSKGSTDDGCKGAWPQIAAKILSQLNYQVFCWQLLLSAVRNLAVLNYTPRHWDGVHTPACMQTSCLKPSRGLAAMTVQQECSQISCCATAMGCSFLSASRPTSICSVYDTNTGRDKLLCGAMILPSSPTKCEQGSQSSPPQCGQGSHCSSSPEFGLFRAWSCRSGEHGHPAACSEHGLADPASMVIQLPVQSMVLQIR